MREGGRKRGSDNNSPGLNSGRELKRLEAVLRSGPLILAFSLATIAIMSWVWIGGLKGTVFSSFSAKAEQFT